MSIDNIKFIDKKITLKKIKQATRTYCFGTIILGLLLTMMTLLFSYQFQYQTGHMRLHATAESYGRWFAQVLDRRINLTRTLHVLIKQFNGDYEKFEASIADIYDRNEGKILSIQFAPNANVKYIYPSKGNENGYVNLLEDPNRKEEAEYSIKSRQTTVAGPFDLYQGGNGFVIRYPVFLKNYLIQNNNNEYFWGFCIVVVDTKSILDESNIANLEKFDLDYRLVKHDVHAQKDILIKESTDKKFKDYEEHIFTIPGYSVSLQLCPKSGFVSVEVQVVILILCLCLTLLTTLLVYYVGRTRSQNKILQDLAVMDVLTNLLNRRGGDGYINDFMENHKNESAVLIALDIDNFKSLNDTYGHALGDVALKKLANNIHKVFGSDGTALIRNGGDEFLIFIPNTTPDMVQAKIEKFASTIVVIYDKGNEIKFSISVGFAHYPNQANDLSNLCIKADCALYSAKLQGKGRAQFYNDSMNNIKKKEF